MEGYDEKGKYVKVYIEPNFKSLTNYRRNRPNWNNLFFYKEGKKTRADVGIVKDRSVSRVIKFNDNCFYKLQNESLKDPIFDYYRIKKDTLDEDIRNFGRKINPRLRYNKISKNNTNYKHEKKPVELSFD